MNSIKLSKIIFNAAVSLDKSLLKYSSSKYPKDLGSWGIKETEEDELRRHLSKLQVELKILDLNEEEFPTLKDKKLLEVEIKVSLKDQRKVLDVLKRMKALSLEKYHVVNLKKRTNAAVLDRTLRENFDDERYNLKLDTEDKEYIKEIFYGKNLLKNIDIEEVSNLIGGNYYGVKWHKKYLNKKNENKEAISEGIVTDSGEKITITVTKIPTTSISEKEFYHLTHI